MAQEPKKTRRSSGPREAKPIYAVVSYNQDGQSVKLNKADLQIKLERNADRIVELLESGDGGTVVRVQLPVAQRRKPADQPAA